MEFGPDDPNQIYVSLTSGAIMSRDGGKTFKRIFVRLRG